MSEQMKFTCPNCNTHCIKKIETQVTTWNDSIYKNGDIKRNEVCISSDKMTQYECSKCDYIIVSDTRNNENELWKALLKLTVIKGRTSETE